MVRIIAVLYMLVQPFTASADSPADKFTQGAPYYYDNFDPGQRPWKSERHLNIEYSRIISITKLYSIRMTRKSQSTNTSGAARPSAKSIWYCRIDHCEKNERGADVGVKRLSSHVPAA